MKRPPQLKQDFLSYLNRKKQNYAALAADKFYEMLFPNHPYSMNQYGTDESLKNIVRDDISNAYKESIINSNLLVSAVGNFDLDKLIIAIDGQASTGKSTQAKKIADNLGFNYRDSGAYYRACLLYTSPSPRDS